MEPRTADGPALPIVAAADAPAMAAAGATLVIREWTDSGPSYLHVHRSDDEAWHVLEGTLRFRFRDREVDAEYKAIARQLLTYMMEDPRTITGALDLTFLAKSLERIGDHAKNMSEYVVYLVKGRDVRHLGLETIERAPTRP